MSTEQRLKLYRKAMRHMDNAAKMLSEKGNERGRLWYRARRAAVCNSGDTQALRKLQEKEISSVVPVWKWGGSAAAWVGQ